MRAAHRKLFIHRTDFLQVVCLDAGLVPGAFPDTLSVLSLQVPPLPRRDLPSHNLRLVSFTLIPHTHLNVSLLVNTQKVSLILF